VDRFREAISHYAVELVGLAVAALGVLVAWARKKLLSGEDQRKSALEVQEIREVTVAGVYSVKNTKEMVTFVAKGTNAGFAIAADKKVDVSDLGHLLSVIPAAGPAFEEMYLIPKELGELDAAEAAEVVAHAAAEFSVDDPKAKVIVEHSLKIAHKAYEIVLEAKAMKAGLAAVPSV
jgi:hypothetical protein